MLELNRRALLAFIAVLLLSCFLASAQDSDINIDIIGIDSTDLDQVAIHVSVLDASGKMVSGLGLADFSLGGALADFGKVLKVENVTDDELAFATVLVIDTSSSMAGRPLEQTQAAARAFINGLGEDDPVAIVLFNYSVRNVVGFTTDRALLLRQLDNVGYGGPTALYDATLRGIGLAAESPLPRRAVVILSDGGEYGNVSNSTRPESIRAATINGVPVYTIGLGWNIDRRFLEAIAAESNAAFYDSPTPDELAAIFSELAFVFRSQYIITISADVPADGTRYDFSLNVRTADGSSSAGSAMLRAPIPIPLLFLPDELFIEPIAEDTQITVEIRADQDIESVEVILDGELVSNEPSYTIQPVELQPGEHQLDVTVEDVEGDIGTLSTEFEVAALPPTLDDDFVPPPEQEIADPEVIVVEAGGQTDITQVEFIVDGEVVQTDNEAPYEFDLDPFALLPDEEHVLSIRATNAGGQTTTVTREFEVDSIPPRLTIEGLAPDTVISDRLAGSVIVESQSPIVSLSIEPELPHAVLGNQLDFVLEAASLPPGTNAITITAVDEAGAQSTQTFDFEVAALPPTVELSGLPPGSVINAAQDVQVQAGGQTEIERIEVAYDGGAPQPVEADTFTIPAENLGDGAHEATVSVTNASGETSTITLPFTIDLPPTPTLTPTTTNTPTDTPVPTDTNTPLPTETSTALPTETSAAQPTETSAALPTETSASAPAETSTPVPTDAPTDTPVPADTPTDTPVPTDTPTNTPVPTDAPTVTPVPTDTPTDTPVPTDTNTPLPTNTPVPTDTPTDTPFPTHTPTDTPVPTDTNTPLPTNTPVPTDTNTPLPTNTPVPTDTPTDTPIPTDTPTNTPVPTDTPTDTPVPTDTPTNTPTATVDITATAQAESSLIARLQGTLDADATATAQRETAVAQTPTTAPTELQPADTEAPTEAAVVEPTAQPTLTPVTITEIEAPAADEPATRDDVLAIAAVVGGLALLLLLFLIGRRRN